MLGATSEVPSLVDGWPCSRPLQVDALVNDTQANEGAPLVLPLNKQAQTLQDRTPQYTALDADSRTAPSRWTLPPICESRAPNSRPRIVNLLLRRFLRLSYA